MKIELIDIKTPDGNCDSYVAYPDDNKQHPAVLLLIVTVAHTAPEGSLYGNINLVLFTFIALGTGFVCRYILPVVASAFRPASLFIPAIAASAAD